MTRMKNILPPLYVCMSITNRCLCRIKIVLPELTNINVRRENYFLKFTFK